MTSDVIRCLYMSYNPLFHNCLHGHNFAKSEPIDGLEHLPTDSSTPLTSRSNPPEVDSLFKRTEQVVFSAARNFSGIPKPTCPAKAGGFFSKVEKSGKKSNHKFPKVHERKLKEKNGTKAQSRSGHTSLRHQVDK